MKFLSHKVGEDGAQRQVRVAPQLQALNLLTLPSPATLRMTTFPACGRGKIAYSFIVSKASATVSPDPSAWTMTGFSSNSAT